MTNQRNTARLTGYALILMAIMTGFSFGYAFPKIATLKQPDIIQQNLIQNSGLYASMLAGILVVILLDLLVSWTLYQYFKKDNKNFALLSLFFRIGYTLIFAIATWFLVKNNAKPVFPSEVLASNFHAFEQVWSIGLILFGVHLFIIGLLMKIHRHIPWILWSLTLLAGASYILVHVMKTTFPHLSEVTNLINTILALPMALGELGLAVWLIVKGGKK